jgi:hypothetical protein
LRIQGDFFSDTKRRKATEKITAKSARRYGFLEIPPQSPPPPPSLSSSSSLDLEHAVVVVAGKEDVRRADLKHRAAGRPHVNLGAVLAPKH